MQILFIRMLSGDIIVELRAHKIMKYLTPSRVIRKGAGVPTVFAYVLPS